MKNKIISGIKFTALLLCTIIGGLGILQAPQSDLAKLEQELKHNELTLKAAEAASDTTKSPAGSASASPEKKDSRKKAENQSLSVIGDSVFLGAAPSFKKIYKQANIDAKISRQVCQGLEVAKKMKKKKKLGNTVIISLGTNGNFNQATGQKLIDYLGRKRIIYWIDAYGKNLDIQKQVNRTIHKLVQKNRNVFLIPWSKEGKKHPSWFYQDGTHLNTKGQAGFARFIKKSISPVT